MIAAVVLTPAFASSWSTGHLVGAATATCGSSACMAIGSLLPRMREIDRSISLVIVATTLLSSLAMVAYPLLLRAFDLPDKAAGIILSGSIQNVPQAIGAGLKLLRIALLVPLVLVCLAVVSATEANEEGRPRRVWRFVPWFIPVFLVLLTVNSSGVLPETTAPFKGLLAEGWGPML